MARRADSSLSTRRGSFPKPAFVQSGASIFHSNGRQEADQNVGQDAVFFLAPDRTDRQIAFLDAERGFRFRQWERGPPEIFEISPLPRPALARCGTIDQRPIGVPLAILASITGPNQHGRILGSPKAPTRGKVFTTQRSNATPSSPTPSINNLRRKPPPENFETDDLSPRLGKLG